ncbi:midasin-like [Rosa rugosa]|uniref:midasin-like n=1 Tax=Rosa rugosa TaxID=74645 RepID=UPI002B400EBA|nr:midasin-like [Rosa rugosa]
MFFLCLLVNQVKKPIHDLLYAWRKLKLESWKALLDEVQDQYEINAGKLWFSLYSVLPKRTSPDATEYKLSTIQIVEDFICTSSFGEFRKSLQLLFAFLGHIKTGAAKEFETELKKEPEPNTEVRTDEPTMVSEEQKPEVKVPSSQEKV